MTASTTAAQPATPAAHARFRDLVSYQSQHGAKGIPPEVMEYLAAKKVFPVACPPGMVGRNALAPLRGWPGLSISIAECTPQQGPVAHNHTGTLETFFCLNGRFDLLWGNGLKYKTSLSPGDMCSVPPGVYRSFRNLTDENARLLVLIQGDATMSDKIEMPREVGASLRKQYGDQVMDLLAGINMRFNGEDADDVTPERMQSRLIRAADWTSVDAGNAATIHPLMAPPGHPLSGQAPVESWPGLTVSVLQLEVGAESTATIDGEHCQWLINVGQSPCQVDLNHQTFELAAYDLVRAEPNTTRTVRCRGTTSCNVLLATQGHETIDPRNLGAV